MFQDEIFIDGNVIWFVIISAFESMVYIVLVQEGIGRRENSNSFIFKGH